MVGWASWVEEVVSGLPPTFTTTAEVACCSSEEKVEEATSKEEEAELELALQREESLLRLLGLTVLTLSSKAWTGGTISALRTAMSW